MSMLDTKISRRGEQKLVRNKSIRSDYMDKFYKVAIVGATGVVGRTAIKILEEKNLPISEYAFFASERSAGKIIEFKNKNYEVQELKEDSFDKGFDFAIFSAGRRNLTKVCSYCCFKKMHCN